MPKSVNWSRAGNVIAARRANLGKGNPTLQAQEPIAGIPAITVSQIEAAKLLNIGELAGKNSDMVA